MTHLECFARTAACTSASPARRMAGFAAKAALGILLCVIAMASSAQGVGNGVGLNGNQSLDSRLDASSVDARAGVAAALAIQMPGSYVPGKTVMRVGTGVFKGESALGLSFRRTSENNGWSLTGGVGVSRAGVAASVGAEWVFD